MELVLDTRMADPNPSASAIDAVLAALDRLAGDLRRRSEEAESRAAASDERAALERQARAEAAETAARENAERLRRDLLDAIQKAVTAARAAEASAAQAAARLDRHSAERSPDPPPVTQAQGGYAWIEDDPGPPWWRRLFRRWRR